MTAFLKLVSGLGLALTVVPSVLVLGGRLSWTQHAATMLAGAVLWFASAPFWMRERGGTDA